MVRLLRLHAISGWRRHLPLPGRPDFAWRRARVAVFVDGCFWHGHNCGNKNLTPKANALLWQTKFGKNKRRDRKVNTQLREMGWSVVRIWECTLQKKPLICVEKIKRALG